MYSFLFLVFFIVVVLQVGYYVLLLSRFSFLLKQNSNHKNYPVSIIVACRNEKDNLERNLPKLLAQKYSKFEIILVDDASTDDTLSIMEGFSEKHDMLHYYSIPKTDAYKGNKKNALTLGIQNAQYEHLIFTDADCEPSTKFWIEKMSAQFSGAKQIVLGYGAYRKTSSWLNKLIRYETLMTALQYFSYAKIGLPYMGVGRNIAYTKSVFKKANGFQSHQNIKSGDDDLFINQMGTRGNTGICWQSEAHTISEPEVSLAKWLRQKRRHITTATFYKPIHQFLLGLFYGTQLLFYALFIFLLIIGYKTPFILYLIGMRYLFYFIVIFFTAKKLKEKDLVLWSPILDFFLVVSQMRIFIHNLVQKPTHW